MQHDEYSVKVETILYIVIKCGEREIYGIPNLFADKTPMDFPLIEAAAMDELLQNGYAQMDFDGKTQIEPHFIELVKACAKSREVAGIDIRKEDGIQRHITVYFVDSEPFADLVTLESLSGSYMGICTLQGSEETKILNWIGRLIDYGDTNVKVNKDIKLESSVLQRCNISEMQKSGCTHEEAELISGAINGKRTVVIARKIRGDSEIGSCSFVCGPEGELEMNMDYSDNMERVLFEPVDDRIIRQKIHKVLSA